MADAPDFIDLDVPVPHDERVSEKMRALYGACVGASVLFPNSIRRETVRRIAYRAGPKGWCMTRKVEGGTRVWKLR